MANYATLKAAVAAVVKSNGNKEITGTNMQSTLFGMIESIAGGYLFKGVATPSTSPGTPDQNVFYIGETGTYTNFGSSYTVPVGSIGVFKYNGSWSRDYIEISGENVRIYHNLTSDNLSTYLPTLKLADLPKNTITYIASNAASQITDIPISGAFKWQVKVTSGYQGGNTYDILQAAYCVDTKRIYIRYSADGVTFSGWEDSGAMHCLKTYHNIDNTNYGDYLPTLKLADLPKNSITYISNNVAPLITDVPYAGGNKWQVISTTGYPNTAYDCLQRAYLVDSGICYIRYSADGTNYGAWVSDESVKLYGPITNSTYSEMLPSLLMSNLPKNSIAYISSNVQCSDAPVKGSKKWQVFTTHGYMGYAYDVLQHCYDIDDGIEFIRYSSDGATFGSWQMNSNPLYAMSMFREVGAVGDSFTEGSIYKDSSTHIGYRPDMTWIAQLSRMNGFKYYPYAKGGTDTEEYLTDQLCLPALLNGGAHELYMLFMGINDAVRYRDEPSFLGSVADIHIGTPSSNPNTFYGNYAKIIEAIQNYAPESVQVMMTVRYTNSYEEEIATINNAIKEIASTYGIPVLDLSESLAYTGNVFSTMLIGGHPTLALHSAIANQINILLHKCVIENSTYFKGYGGLMTKGSYSSRPLTANNGHIYWDTTNNIVWKYDGGEWLRIYPELPLSGASSDRPIGASNGYMYFDTTIGKPIWWNGTWVLSDGTNA